MAIWIKLAQRNEMGPNKKKIGSNSDKKDRVGADFGESVGAPQTNIFLMMAPILNTYWTTHGNIGRSNINDLTSTWLQFT